LPRGAEGLEVALGEQLLVVLGKHDGHDHKVAGLRPRRSTPFRPLPPTPPVALRPTKPRDPVWTPACAGVTNQGLGSPIQRRLVFGYERRRRESETKGSRETPVNEERRSSGQARPGAPRKLY